MTDNPVSNDDDVFDREPTPAGGRKKRLAAAVALLVAGGIAGGAVAATSSASAAATPTPAATSPAPYGAGPTGPANTATPVRPGEKAVTGADLATLKAAALKAVPGGAVFRVETDVDGATYEAHMTKADGTVVTVKFGKSLTVTAIQAGMGAGGPGGPAGGMGPGRPGGQSGATPPAANGSHV
jgi:hypothetical protein